MLNNRRGKKKKKGLVMLSFPGAEKLGDGGEEGRFDFEHIRCAAEPVTATQGRRENSALHF